MEKLKVAIGCDHGGFDLKQKVIDYLKARDIEFKDFGVYIKEASDYPEIAKEVAKEVAGNKYDRGILICGTGIPSPTTQNTLHPARSY